MDGDAQAWLAMDASGKAVVDKLTVMQRTGLHPRDLHLLDPFSYASTILGRDRAIVLSLGHIKAIITSQEVLIRNPFGEDIIPVVEELGRLLQCQGPPFELVALEVIIEAVCSFLDARTTELESFALAVVHRLLSPHKKVNHRCLDQVRKLKDRITRLRTSSLTVKVELEQLLDDDGAMCELLLTRKLHDSAMSCNSAEATDEVELLFESCFMRVNRTLLKLNELQAYIDDTDDHIKLQLYRYRNGLLKMELIVKGATLAMALYSGWVGVFGMNIPFPWNDDHSYIFKWVVLMGGMMTLVTFLVSYALSQRVGVKFFEPPPNFPK